MIQVTFLAHSGFLVELEHCCLVFDWWKGKLPSLPQKPVVIFASHWHADHFSPDIFSLGAQRENVLYVLSRDIHLSEKKRIEWGLTAERMRQIYSVGPNETLTLPLGVQVHTLPSTDEGVAFLVETEQRRIYHAGDLNWWHWEGEELSVNRNMEVNFKRNLEPLRNLPIDLAFVPLDPRQEDAYDWGLVWLLEHFDVRRVFPMHLWGKFDWIARCKAAHPEMASRLEDVRQEAQCWVLD